MKFRAIRKAARSLVLIFAVALGVRMAFAWSQVRQIPRREVLAIVPFQQETGNIAYALAEGKGFSNVFRTETGPTAWLAPVYPIILGAIFRIFGIFTVRAFFAAVAFNILCSSAVCAPIFYAGKRLWGPGVAAGAAWLWAIFPNGILIPFEWIWDTSLAAFLAAAILWATLEVAVSEKNSDWCAYGVLWGLTLLTNPALGALLPFLLGWAVMRSSATRGARWKRVALAFGTTALCCLPWTVRNYVDFHRVIPLRSNLAFELWSGNNEVLDPDARGGRRVMTRMEEVQRYTKLGETAFMDEKSDLAWAFIRTHWRLETHLTWRRFLNFWVGTDAPWKNFVEARENLVRVTLLASFVTTCGAFLGVVALWWKQQNSERARRSSGDTRGSAEEAKRKEKRMPGTVFPLAVFPVIFPALYYVTHAYLRLRHPIDPIVMLLTAMAAAAAWPLTREN